MGHDGPNHIRREMRLTNYCRTCKGRYAARESSLVAGTQHVRGGFDREFLKMSGMQERLQYSGNMLKVGSPMKAA